MDGWMDSGIRNKEAIGLLHWFEDHKNKAFIGVLCMNKFWMNLYNLESPWQHWPGVSQAFHPGTKCAFCLVPSNQIISQSYFWIRINQIYSAAPPIRDVMIVFIRPTSAVVSIGEITIVTCNELMTASEVQGEEQRKQCHFTWHLGERKLFLMSAPQKTLLSLKWDLVTAERLKQHLILQSPQNWSKLSTIRSLRESVKKLNPAVIMV